MSQGFAANGTIHIGHLDDHMVDPIINHLTAALDVQDLSIDNEGDLLHFTAFGEVCAGDDIPGDLQRLAKTYGVNFMARIDENDEGYEVHFFGDDAQALQALKVEYAVNTAADAFRFIGVEPTWLRPAMRRLAEQKPIRAVFCADSVTPLWVDADVPVDLLLLDLDIEGAMPANIITGLDEETRLYASSIESDTDDGPNHENVEKFFERFNARLDG